MTMIPVTCEGWTFWEAPAPNVELVPLGVETPPRFRLFIQLPPKPELPKLTGAKLPLTAKAWPLEFPANVWVWSCVFWSPPAAPIV